MPLEDDPTAETSAAVEPSPLATVGGGATDFPFDEDSFPFPLPILLLLLLKTCVTLSMTLPFHPMSFVQWAWSLVLD